MASPLNKLAAMGEAWTIREKLCLASCVMKMTENWGAVSKQMKQMSERRSRPSEFYSVKNCAQQYTSLVESLGPQKRRRTGEGAPFSDSVATQLVSKLTFDRLDELKQLISHEKSVCKKMRKEIEAIKSGELDHQLDVMLEQIEQEEANEEYHSDGDESATSETTTQKSVDESPTKILSPLTPSVVTSSPTVSNKEAEFFPSPANVSPFIEAKSPFYSPSKPPFTPISIVQPGSATASPSLSPISIFTHVSPSKSLSQSPPQKVDNINLNRPEMQSPKIIEIKEEPYQHHGGGGRTTSTEPSSVAARISEPKTMTFPPIEIEHREETHTVQSNGHTDTSITITRRFKRDSGGSTSSDTSSGLARGSISSRSPHPIPAHFPDMETYRTWKRMILNVHQMVANHKHANLFMKPVTDESAPNYSRIIRRPIALNDLKKSIDQQMVSTVNEFRRDLLLMFANAVMYNPTNHVVHVMARDMADDVVPRIDELLSTPINPEVPPCKSLRSTRTTTSSSVKQETDTKVNRKRENSETTVGNESMKRKC